MKQVPYTEQKFYFDVIPNNNLNIHSCIKFVTQSCLKPLSNEQQSMFKSLDSRAV